MSKLLFEYRYEDVHFQVWEKDKDIVAISDGTYDSVDVPILSLIELIKQLKENNLLKKKD